MTDFSNVRVDDIVVELIRTHCAGHKVTKVTAKYFDTGKTRWRKDSGQMAGAGDAWSMRSVVPMRPDLQPQVDKTTAKLLARQLEPKLRTATLEQLRRVEVILGEAEV